MKIIKFITKLMKKIVKFVKKFDDCTPRRQIGIVIAAVPVLGVALGLFLDLLIPDFGTNPVTNTPAAPMTTVEVIYVPGETVTVIPTPSRRGIEQARVTTKPTPTALPATTVPTSPEVTASSSQVAPSTITTKTTPPTSSSEEPPPASTSVSVAPSTPEASPSN